MEQPRITVVLPIYRVEPYLDRCLNSVVHQTYRNLEIILVDDGSPDNCPQMCEQWAARDDRIRVIHKQNAGLGMARNTGIEAATGAYICFVDSDDYIDPATIEKAYNAIRETGAEVAVFGYTRVDTQGNPVKVVSPQPVQTCYSGTQIQTCFLPDYIDPEHVDTQNRNLCLSAWSSLFSMDLVNRTGWRFVSEREMISEDSYSLIWLYQYVQKVAILPEALYFYCENGSSLTQTYRPDRFAKIKAFSIACHAMAAEAGFPPAIGVRISGLFVGFSVAAMKQIVAADIPKKEKKAILADVIDDEVMQTALHDPDCRYHSPFRKLLFWAMGRKLYAMTYAFVKLQLWKEHRNKT